MSDVLFTIQHPADVHLFRHAIAELEGAGHDVHVYARRKDVNVDLLEAYGIDHEVLAGRGGGVLGTVAMQATYEYRVLRAALSVRPDVMCADGGIAISHVSSVIDAPSLVFTDTEHVVDTWPDRRTLIFRFADEVHTPECYWLDLGDHHRRYPGYHELAYLHPDRFEPDPAVLDRLPVDSDRPLAFLRLVSWDAFHDRGEGGIASAATVIESLRDHGLQVLLSTEGSPPPAYADLEVDVPVHEIHHVLEAVDVFVGDSATMATECAVLGTPAVFVSSFDLGYVSELEGEYGLAVRVDPADDPDLPGTIAQVLRRSESHWRARRRALLADKIDTTDYVLDTIYSHLDDERDRSAGHDGLAPGTGEREVTREPR